MIYCKSKVCKMKNRCSTHVCNAPDGSVEIKDFSLQYCEIRAKQYRVNHNNNPSGIDPRTNLKYWQRVYEMRESGMKYKDIAREFGVSRQRVRFIYEQAKKSGVFSP